LRELKLLRVKNIFDCTSTSRKFEINIRYTIMQMVDKPKTTEKANYIRTCNHLCTR